MLQFRRELLLSLLKLSDVCILLTGLLLVSWFATAHMKDVGLVDFLYMRVKVVNLIGLLVMILLWYMICHYFHLYHSRRLQSSVQEWKDIAKATTTGMVLFLAGAKAFNISLFSPLFVLFFWLSTTVLTIVFRILLRFVLKKVRASGKNLRFLLVVGTNEVAYDFVRMVKENRDAGYRVVGFVDDRVYVPKRGVRLLGRLEDMSHIIRELIIDEIVVALPIKSYYEQIQAIIEHAEEQGTAVRCLNQPFNTKIAKLSTEKLDGRMVLEISSRFQEESRHAVKRALDIAVGSVLMLLTLPVMLVAAIAVKVTSPGPVFFAQDRVGFNKRIFRLYKFRTMVVGAEKLQKELESDNEMDGPVFKIQRDPRITTAGRWLRRMSIDELPQLYNVVKGDMSLVGPRPLPVRDYNGFRKDWQRRRFSVRPGLTCLWQVNGRNNCSFEDWMNLDMEYIDNWSFFADLKIILKTIPVVLNSKGAS